MAVFLLDIGEWSLVTAGEELEDFRKKGMNISGMNKAGV